MQKLAPSPLLDAKERGHFSFGSVSNTTARDLILDVNGLDAVSVQIVSTGTLTATITVRASNSYIAGPQDIQFGLTSAAGAAPVRAGSFVDITSRVTGITNPAGAGGDCIVNVSSSSEPSVAHCYLLIRFTPASGSGNLDMYVSGKTLGE